ncbi:hypothetical protein D3Z48_19685 [Clostridiaceae bacterium]|nr:hypothetical protein [Clostridiaceae bacterium]
MNSSNSAQRAQGNNQSFPAEYRKDTKTQLAKQLRFSLDNFPESVYTKNRKTGRNQTCAASGRQLPDQPAVVLAGWS